MIQATALSKTEEFLQRVRALPKGKSIDECLQCGTCTASCPAAHVMDFGPRGVISGIRAGELGKVVGSDSAWACASCYLCTVRCPAGIPFTDVMYELKRYGMETGLLPRREPNAIMANTFADVVDKYGRNEEVVLVRKYFFRLNPLRLFGQIGLGLRLFFKGRLSLFPKKIKGIAGLRRMMAERKREAVHTRWGHKVTPD